MIYFISDIHANLFALEAVLNAIPKNSTILCSGDIVGYYTEPNEVCELLQERKVICIKGNHDKYVLGLLNYNKKHEYKYGVERTRKL